MPKIQQVLHYVRPKKPKKTQALNPFQPFLQVWSQALNSVSLEIDHPNLQKPSQVSRDLEILEDLHSIESWLVHQESNHINNGLLQSQYKAG